MKILICGSEGRIMSATIPYLLNAGHEIIGVDTCEKWGHDDKRRDYQFVRGNCSDPDLLLPLLKGVHGVIQAAATLYGVVGFHRRPADILSNDVQLHQAVLRASLKAGVARVVYMSSSMVYECCQNEPYHEEEVDSAPAPRTDYGLSKLVGERLSMAFHTQYQIPFTIWRPFNVIDPAEEGSDDAGVSHVFADLLHRLVDKLQNPVDILGDGNQVRSFVHIREAAEAIARFSFEARTENETFNLGRDECVTMRDLALRLYRSSCDKGLIPECRPLQFRSLPIASTDVRRRVGSFDKIRRELGWCSVLHLDSAVADCVTAYSARKTPRATTA
jgi:nucleoside-diphosphate-sugar epimerase